MTKACWVLACQVPPPPGLLLCSPGSCFGSLESETTLQAYLQGLEPPGQQSGVLDTQLLLGTLCVLGWHGGSGNGVGKPQGWEWG